MKLLKTILVGSLFLISQNVFAYGCQDLYIPKDSYCTPDGDKLFKYGKVTQEMKNIKTNFRGKTYTYKDLIKPLNYNELVGIDEFERNFISFTDELDKKLNNLTYSQLEQVLKIRGDYVEKILNKKWYNPTILSCLEEIDKNIISLFDKFKVSPENQNLFKTGSSEKHRMLEIMQKYIEMTPY
ncbi:hypothetical protein [Lonepinella sp. BR2271]|uniref:hypothetical protein n=1 Tax=Lonepinella sp. BR2271 TaxID=3434550 RepID=UPI003F6E199C